MCYVNNTSDLDGTAEMPVRTLAAVDIKGSRSGWKCKVERDRMCHASYGQDTWVVRQDPAAAGGARVPHAVVCRMCSCSHSVPIKGAQVGGLGTGMIVFFNLPILSINPFPVLGW